MTTSILQLPDGTRVSSGLSEVLTIKSLTHSHNINPSTNLDFGTACSSQIKVDMLDFSEVERIRTGDELRYYAKRSNGVETLIGIFYVESPIRTSAHTYSFTAYDRMIKFDVDISEWLVSQPDWPYTIDELLQLVCEKCGVQKSNDFNLVNGSLQVPKFIDKITGRNLVEWIAGANASYACINSEGLLSFKSFGVPTKLSLSRKKSKIYDYATKPIVRVVVQQEEDDVGVSWPPSSEGETYAILRNPLLSTFSTEELEPFVENIYNRISGTTYTPMELSVFDPDWLCRAGEAYIVEDLKGVEHTTFVFSCTHRGGVSTLRSTGDFSRASTAAINGVNSVKVLQGRVASFKASLEEFSVSLSETSIEVDKVSQASANIQLQTDSIKSRVESVENDNANQNTTFTEIKQTNENLSLTLGRVTEQLGEKANSEDLTEFTKRFTFGDDGFRIYDTASGMGIGVSESQVAFTGGQNPTTVITPNQMETTKLVVGEQLDLGEFSFLPRANGNLSFRYIGGK